jgi:hypothetical protein
MYAAGAGAVVLVLLPAAVFVLRRGSKKPVDQPRRRPQDGRTGDDVLDELESPARGRRDLGEIDVNDLFDDPPARPAARLTDADDIFADPIVPLQPDPAASAEEMIVPDDGPPPPPAAPPVAKPIRARPVK